MLLVHLFWRVSPPCWHSAPREATVLEGFYWTRVAVWIEMVWCVRHLYAVAAVYIPLRKAQERLCMSL